MRVLTVVSVILSASSCAWAGKGPENDNLLKETTWFYDASHVDRNFNTSSSVNTLLSVPGKGRISSIPEKLNSTNIDNLALLGMAMLGGLAIFHPTTLSPGSYGRSFGESNLLGNSLVGISEFVMSKVENSLDDLPSLPRLDPQECMKRAICEVNHQPKKYGIMGLILQVLFPPYTETKNSGRVVSKYQLAARYGRQESAACGTQYDGCMINFLDLFQGITNGFLQFFS